MAKDARSHRGQEALRQPRPLRQEQVSDDTTKTLNRLYQRQGQEQATRKFLGKPPVKSDHECKAMKDTVGDDEQGELIPLDSLDADNLDF